LDNKRPDGSWRSVRPFQVWIQQPQLSGLGSRLGPAAGAQLPADLVDVGLDRAGVDEQPLGNLPIRRAFGYERWDARARVLDQWGTAL